jgi:glycosyltransferase involved in cell wall biosynthesis
MEKLYFNVTFVNPLSLRERVLCVVAGDGPERGPLERAARANALPMRFVGAVEPPVRDLLLRAADAFVLPSRTLRSGATEGAPVALLEAMGAGLAVIASDVGGVAELAGDAVVLVPPDAPETLAAALATQLAEPARRALLGERALARAAPHAWPRVAARIEQWLTRSR